MAWTPFTVNEFIQHFVESQDVSKDFHYSWILVLAIMISWSPPLK